MKTTTRTLAIIVTTAASASLLTGLAMSTGSSAAPNQPTPSTLSMPMAGTDMGSMDMGSMGMGSMMGSMMGRNGMIAMHDEVHAAMKGIVADDVLAACDKAYDTMAPNGDTSTSSDTSAHASHHVASQP